jgi:integrase
MHDAETLIAAIHRDWGEAQGNYDEFRFFTGLRPSEEIALVLSDLDLVNGLSVSTRLESMESISARPRPGKIDASNSAHARFPFWKDTFAFARVCEPLGRSTTTMMSSSRTPVSPLAICSALQSDGAGAFGL